MFKVPYFLEGISNIFKPVLTNKEKFENTKGAENYRGKLIFDENACIGCGIASGLGEHPATVTSTLIHLSNGPSIA